MDGLEALPRVLAASPDDAGGAVLRLRRAGSRGAGARARRRPASSRSRSPSTASPTTCWPCSTPTAWTPTADDRARRRQVRRSPGPPSPATTARPPDRRAPPGTRSLPGSPGTRSPPSRQGRQGRQGPGGPASTPPPRRPSPPPRATTRRPTRSARTSSASGRSSRRPRSAWATMTLTGHLVRANRALAAVVGRRVDELVGLPYADLVAHGDAGGVRDLVEAISAGRLEVAQVEHSLAGAGSVLTGRHAGSPRRSRRSAASTDARCTCSCRRRTSREQRRAAERLRQSEERFRLLVEAVEDYAIFMLDPHGIGGELERRRAAHQGLHRRRDHRRSTSASSTRPASRPPGTRSTSCGSRCATATTRRRAGGSARTAPPSGRTSSSRPCATQAGEHMGFTKVTRDITERRHATRAARARRGSRWPRPRRSSRR